MINIFTTRLIMFWERKLTFLFSTGGDIKNIKIIGVNNLEMFYAASETYAHDSIEFYHFIFTHHHILLGHLYRQHFPSFHHILGPSHLQHGNASPTRVYNLNWPGGGRTILS